jgi:hypothetical protein
VPEAATRYDEYGQGFRNNNNNPPPPVQPAPPRPVPVQPPPVATKVYDGSRPRRSPAARAMLTLLVLVLIVVTPLAAGCVSYRLTTDHWPKPVANWLDSGNP